MSRNTAIKFFTVTNIGTNAQTIVRATNEDEALEVWARGLGRASFGAACELIGVHPEDIEVEEGEEVAEVLAERVNKAKSLDEMWKAFQDIRAEHRDVQREASDLIRWDALPTWTCAPKDTDGVWSWDRTRAIIGSCLLDLTLVTRDTIDLPFDIETAREDEELPEAVEAMFGDDDAPGSYPHDLLSVERWKTHARIAALVTALGGTMGEPDNGWNGLSEEDTLVFDADDGSLALYMPRRGYAWEVEA